MIEVEVQNETHQTQERLRFAAVPRIGEGIRLREPDGCWASYDVLDVWYQKADYGDVWLPYLHVCMTPDDRVAEPAQPSAAPVPPSVSRLQAVPPPREEPQRQVAATRPLRPVWGEEEVTPFTG